MIIQREIHRNRVVKGWAFMDLSEEEIIAIRKFLESGNTDDLPAKFQRMDYSVFLTGRR